ncbi:F-box/LRR-repeat protein [Gossypium australe]|uniref:F-box/LRR-repeat protein n=1 Tax=Gossypium australe TaxID=47621 RepID=A0A5B6V5F0_9ROSI|nr:F-box/LRR-repeat protein [Gossypium australe]
MSALPDAILHKILSLLPTKHSVQTSILSERWIHLWKFTPVIHIPMYSPYKHITPSECTFIHNTWAQHQAPKLLKFSLQFSSGPLRNHDPDVQHCIEFPISRQFQLIYAQQCLSNIKFCLTSSLKCFLFNPNPPCDLPFASLKTLCFFDCAIDNETLKALVSKFPVLEGFTIDRCHRLRNFKVSWCQSMRLKHVVLRCIVDHDLNLEIDVSSLSTFKFCGDLMKISFTSLPSIVEAAVFQWSYRPYGQ